MEKGRKCRTDSHLAYLQPEMFKSNNNKFKLSLIIDPTLELHQGQDDEGELKLFGFLVAV